MDDCVAFLQWALPQDIRRELPDGRFDLILCRNLVFTYFAAAERGRITDTLLSRLRPGGYLVPGAHETAAGLQRPCGALPIFR